MSEPVFAVVGHANPGKSSIVSTLAADDSVRVGAMPGTTLECRSFPMRVDDTTLYTLVDTPGFERPRQMLAWLKENETSTAGRREAVEQFVRLHDGSDKFPHERELLRPILEGAAVLYVVDGSKPPSSMNEAEMEVLRWTGQPRMALINPVDQENYSAEWRGILDQYFNLVRVFDAHQADFVRRVELLRALRELNDPWRANMDAAINSLTADRQRCQRESARSIAEMLADMLLYTKKMHLGEDAVLDTVKTKLTDRYYSWLRKREQACHDALKLIYEHHQLEINSNALDAVNDDLFSESSMNQLGLTKKQLLATSAAAGAVVGGAIDLSVGGLSFLTGTLIGGAAGAAAGFYGINKLPKAILGGDALKIGPMTNANFAWVVLDRALLLHESLARRAHAKRGELDVTHTNGDGIVTHLPTETRRNIEAQLAVIRKQGSREWRNQQTLDTARRELTDCLDAVLGSDVGSKS